MKRNLQQTRNAMATIRMTVKCPSPGIAVRVDCPRCGNRASAYYRSDGDVTICEQCMRQDRAKENKLKRLHRREAKRCAR